VRPPLRASGCEARDEGGAALQPRADTSAAGRPNTREAEAITSLTLSATVAGRRLVRHHGGDDSRLLPWVAHWGCPLAFATRLPRRGAARPMSAHGSSMVGATRKRSPNSRTNVVTDTRSERADRPSNWGILEKGPCRSAKDVGRPADSAVSAIAIHDSILGLVDPTAPATRQPGAVWPDANDARRLGPRGITRGKCSGIAIAASGEYDEHSGANSGVRCGRGGVPRSSPSLHGLHWRRHWS
jgi:hypothetical protein